MTNGFKQELTNLGFQQDRAKRGLVTWIMAILAILLFGSVTLNILQAKKIIDREDEHNASMKELNSTYNGVLLQMLAKAQQLENKVDTVIKKKF